MAIDLKKFILRFVEEARDHLAQLHDGLAALEQGEADAERINALFRSAHTIKGSSRMLKLTGITDTAHKLEDVLGALRASTLTFSPELAQLLYQAMDAIALLVDRLAENPDPATLGEADARLCAALSQAAAGQPAQPQQVEPAAETAAAVKASPAASDARGEPAKAATPAPKSGLKTPDTVRLRLSKLDELVKLMGEVVSSHGRLRQRLLEIRQIGRSALTRLPPDDALHGALQQFERALRDDAQFQELLMDELHDRALVMRMLPLGMVFDPAARLLRELARSIGKQVECEIQGSEIELDRQMIDKLSDPVVHLIRNSVDHGLETPEARRQAGKPAYGKVRLSAHQDGAWVVVEVADDGAGISLQRVRDKALRKGFISEAQAASLSDQETIDLIFLPGFSTSGIITDLSGRGVGMDVVKQTVVDDLQGMIHVDTQLNRGTRFSLRLPLSLAVMRVLLISSCGLPFGFTAQYVAELVRVPASSLMAVAERQAIAMRNEFVPIVPLHRLLGLACATDEMQRPQTGQLLLLVVRVRSEKLALQVDELLDERDMVIKPLPPHMQHQQLVSGMVVTGKNELVSILHAPALLEMARALREDRGDAERRQQAPSGGYHILVVDDSTNTREIEKEVLEAHGYRVTLAEDGRRGLEEAMAHQFDAVLTDVEMPNMDGFTLTHQLRSRDSYQHTPIVIITSREQEQDKRRGIEVGADAYIVKGDFDQSSLVDTLAALLG